MKWLEEQCMNSLRFGQSSFLNQLNIVKMRFILKAKSSFILFYTYVGLGTNIEVDHCTNIGV